MFEMVSVLYIFKMLWLPNTFTSGLHSVLLLIGW